MANIMVNEACNLKCEYCFASEFVNRAPTEMTLDAFKEALGFVLRGGREVQVGIIGGEPTIYTHINEALELAMNDPRAFPVSLYTNAVFLENIRPELLEDNKFRMLVNCNSPRDMGEKQYEKMFENLWDFVTEHRGVGRFKLSVNLYKPDFDYRYVLALVEDLECDTIRVSISVPSRNDIGKEDPLSYFRRMKPLVLRFTRDMCERGVIPGFDCNFMPSCVFTEPEIDYLEGMKELYRKHLNNHNETFWARSIISDIGACSPVIDILPDLTAVRCFGLSEYTKENIRDFRNIGELEAFYENSIDMASRSCCTADECRDCYKRMNGKCTAGCLTYKMDMITTSKESGAD